jgi:hypothetical protein
MNFERLVLKLLLAILKCYIDPPRTCERITELNALQDQVTRFIDEPPGKKRK